MSMKIELELECKDELTALDIKLFLEALCDFVTDQNRNWKIKELRVVNEYGRKD